MAQAQSLQFSLRGFVSGHYLDEGEAHCAERTLKAFTQEFANQNNIFGVIKKAPA